MILRELVVVDDDDSGEKPFTYTRTSFIARRDESTAISSRGVTLWSLGSSIISCTVKNYSDCALQVDLRGEDSS